MALWDCGSSFPVPRFELRTRKTPRLRAGQAQQLLPQLLCLHASHGAVHGVSGGEQPLHDGPASACYPCVLSAILIGRWPRLTRKDGDTHPATYPVTPVTQTLLFFAFDSHGVKGTSSTMALRGSKEA